MGDTTPILKDTLVYLHLGILISKTPLNQNKKNSLKTNT